MEVVKALTYLSIFLLSVSYFIGTRYIEGKKEIERIQLEKNALNVKVNSLENYINEYNKKQMEANSTIERIREKVKYIKTDCDCYNTRIPDSIANILQNNKHRAY